MNMFLARRMIERRIVYEERIFYSINTDALCAGHSEG